MLHTDSNAHPITSLQRKRRRINWLTAALTAAVGIAVAAIIAADYQG